MPRRPAALALIVAMLAVTAPALADAPKVDDLSPAGARRGEPTVVAFRGANLGPNPRLVAPFACAVEAGGDSDAGTWRARLTPAAEVAAGVYLVRVVTDGGLSNPIPLVVGQLPQAAEAEDNSRFEVAQAVNAPVVIEGQSPGNDVDFFKFSGLKGQRVVIDAACARLGSGVDPSLRLTTGARKFLAANDDAAGLGIDARIVAELPEDGEYVVELSDSRYAPGARPSYRLTIGAVPVADEVFPLGGRRGETVGLELRGGTLPGTRVGAATLTAPAGAVEFHPGLTDALLGLAGPTDPVLQVELPGPLAVGDLPELREPADPAAAPIRAVAPVVLNGRIDPPGDEDRFTLVAAPGAKYQVTVAAAVLGSDLDGTLTILGPDGKNLATADDAPIGPRAGRRGNQRNPMTLVTPDPALEFTAPAGNGPVELTIALRDLEGRGGVGFPYRIAVEPDAPGFDLVLGDSQVSVPRNGWEALIVTADRDGYDGPIAVEVADPPAGLIVRPAQIAPGQGAGALGLSATADAGFGPVELRVVGRAEGPTGPIVVEATRTVVVAQQNNVPVATRSQRVLPAAPATAEPVGLELPADPVVIALGTGTTVKVAVRRDAGADSALTIKPAGPLPKGLAVPDAPIAEKAGEAAVTINAAPDAAVGRSTIAMAASGKLADQDRSFALPVVLVEVVRPATIELTTTAVEVTAGQAVEVKGKVVRRGAFAGPVTVRLDDLPAGLKAEPATVAAEATEFTLSLAAEPTAAPVEAKAKAVGVFKIGDQDDPAPPTAPLAVKVLVAP